MTSRKGEPHEKNTVDQAPLNGKLTVHDLQDLITVEGGKIIVDSRYDRLVKTAYFDSDTLVSCVEDNIVEDIAPELSFIDWVSVFEDYRIAKYGDRDDLTLMYGV